MEPMILDHADVPANTLATPPPANWDWADRGTSHVAFRNDEQLPFREGRELGHGVNGPVMEVEIKGVRVALKKIYCRHKIQQKDLQEIDIMKKLTHPHIIQVVGSYNRGKYLGILLYPVATCDMTTFLEDLSYLQGYLDYDDEEKPPEYFERMLRCATISFATETSLEKLSSLEDVVKAARVRLWQSYGCIASAISYLHENSIRHKDLKPHNILLSPDGLWITDFGQSTDFSDHSNSATSNGERGTIKYCAPEVASYQKSGRAADIFSLGCIFFEMTGILDYFTFKEMAEWRIASDRSFHNNLNRISKVFDDFGNTQLRHLPMSLVRDMISRNPADRPNIASIRRSLTLLQCFSAMEPGTFSKDICLAHDRHAHLETPILLGTKTEVSITIGNTCQLECVESMGKKIPVVVFVDCSFESAIEQVIFFQPSSSEYSTTTVLRHPFARRENLLKKYTQAVLLVLKPSFYWEDLAASRVLLDDDPNHIPRSVLPVAWKVQISKIYDSKTIKAIIRHYDD